MSCRAPACATAFPNLCHARMLVSNFPFPKFIAFALCVASAQLQAEEAPLRLSEALARAAGRNPGLLPHAYDERAADARLEQAGLRPNPTLEFEAENFAGTGVRQGVRSLEATVQASQTIERGGKREKRMAVASRERTTAAKEYAVRRNEVLAATAVAFVQTLVAQQRVILAEEPLKLAREIATAAEERVRAGAASPVESARARAAIATAQGELARAHSDRAAARARLAATWGGALTEVSVVAGALTLPDALPAESVLFDKLGGHPRLAWQEAVIASRRAALDWEKGQTAQDITVGGGLRFFREGSDAGLVAGVSVPLPTRNRNQGNIRAARENLAGAEQTVHAIEAELRVELSAAWLEVSAAHAAVQNLRRDALPATTEAHAVVRRAYVEGQLPMIDVLDAQRALMSLRRELLELEASFAVAHARAEALVDATFPQTSALLSSR